MYVIACITLVPNWLRVGVSAVMTPPLCQSLLGASYVRQCQRAAHVQKCSVAPTGLYILPSINRGSAPLHPSVARGVLAPLIRHGWPKGNPPKAFFARPNIHRPYGTYFRVLYHLIFFT